jgi:hypothetical protein
VTYSLRLWLEDLLLVLALGVVLALRPAGALSGPLAAAIGLVLVWGVATLHVPSKVLVSDAGVSFSRYGRTHAFAWSDVARVRVRRFPVGDRVLVRLLPSPPWRGRYWVADGAAAYGDVVKELSRMSRTGPPVNTAA